MGRGGAGGKRSRYLCLVDVLWVCRVCLELFLWTTRLQTEEEDEGETSSRQLHMSMKPTRSSFISTSCNTAAVSSSR